jgi:hypothetical protein
MNERSKHTRIKDNINERRSDIIRIEVTSAPDLRERHKLSLAFPAFLFLLLNTKKVRESRHNCLSSNVHVHYSE